MLPRKIQLKDLPERLQFDLRLQISLRNNAISIRIHYEDQSRFQNYIDEREEKIRILLNETENPVIYDGSDKLYP